MPYNPNAAILTPTGKERALVKRSDITPEIVHQLIRYEPDVDKYFWNERGLDMFTSSQRYKIWNKKYANKEVFNNFSSSGYARVVILGIRFPAQRVIWAFHYGVWPDGEIDHINGNPSDNRLCNLRDVSHAENMRNRRVSSNSKSGVMGVYWNKKSGKWHAQVGLNGRKTHVGYFDNIADAAAAQALHISENFHPNHGRSA